MKRILASTLVALVTAAGLFWPLLQSLGSSSTATSTDPVTITDYQAVYKVDANGRLDAVETISTEFPQGRHGIFRFWDVSDSFDAGVRYLPKNIVVSLDGASEPASLSWETGKRFRVAKIGDPNTYVSPGSHIYRITYRIDDVLSPSSVRQGTFGSTSPGAGQAAKSVFAWSVVAPGWQMRIEKSNIRIELPTKTGTVRCTPSRDGAAPCDITGAGTRNIEVSTGALEARTPVTVRVDLPTAAPDRHTLPWTVRQDPIFGQSVVLVGVVLVLSVLGLLIGYVWERRTREDPPGFPVMYEPPDKLGPVQTAYVTDESLPGKGLVATLLYQAEQGLTELTDNGSNGWEIVGKGTPEQWAAADPVTRSVGENLGVATVDGAFAANGSPTSGQMLQSTQGSIQGTAASWAADAKLVVPNSFELMAKGLVILAMVLAILNFFFNPLLMTLLGLPFAAFAIGGAGMLLAGVGTRRTVAGRDIWSKSGGFERLLSTTSSKERLDFSARKDLYTSFIPFAVAFDCADKWAAKYKVQTGQEPPSPLWYGGALGMSYGFGGSGAFSSFESSLSSSIGAYQATQSSSSSGGGGGGGGGGGSW